MKTLFLIITISIFSIKTYCQDTLILKAGNTGKDAWIWSYDPFEDVNFGESNTSNQGLNNVIRSEVWVWDTGADTIRGVLDFDLSSIPLNATIVEAKLSLFYYANTGFTQQEGENKILIQRITENWSETNITWNNQPKTTILNQVSLAKSDSSTQNYLDINVTDLVNDMIDSAGYGFMFKMENEVIYKGLSFASSEHSNTSLHPKLEIVYNIVDTASPIKNIFKEDEGLLIYPNPATDEISFQLLSENIIPTKLSIINTNGKTVKIIRKNKKTLSLRGFKPGVYYIEFKNKQNRIFKKFIKI